MGWRDSFKVGSFDTEQDPAKRVLGIATLNIGLRVGGDQCLPFLREVNKAAGVPNYIFTGEPGYASKVLTAVRYELTDSYAATDAWLIAGTYSAKSTEWMSGVQANDQLRLNWYNGVPHSFIVTNVNAAAGTVTRIDNTGGVNYDTVQGKSAAASSFAAAGTNEVVVYRLKTAFFNHTGGGGNERIVGSDDGRPAYLDGAGGNDDITGTALNDYLVGGAGNDTLSGGAGSDMLLGGRGVDVMRGGLGNDNYQVDNSADKVVETTSAGIDSVFSSINFKLPDNVENLVSTGSLGLILTGNGLANEIIGGSAADTLVGGEGADTLIGGAGRDVILYQLLRDFSQDSVMDFAPGVDVIDISAIDAISSTRKNDNFNFIGKSAFTAPGQLRYSKVEGGVQVEINVNLDLSADGYIFLPGVSDVSATDFWG